MSAAARTTTKKRDSKASREALLDAASKLFVERGYQGTTTREIAEKAGVDAALIARYFGSKEELYVETLSAGRRPPPPSDPKELIEMILARSEVGLGPVMSALASTDVSETVRDEIRRSVKTRLLEPVADELRERGAPSDEAALRAELVIALAVGLALTRGNKTLPQVSRASRTKLLEAIEPLLDALEQDG